MNKRLTIFLLFALAMFSLPMSAQRNQMKLGRGVVAVNNGSSVTITWRRLAQEPEGAKYNIYIGGTKLNASPLAVTNTTATNAKCPAGSVITVTSVVNGVESAPSSPFTYNPVTLGSTSIKCAYRNVNFTKAGSPLPNDGTFVTKFCWPVDLDGDGEMDYVVNRVYTAKNQDGYEGWGDDKLGGDCLEAYTSEGKHLWTVGLGVHFFAFGGQNDGVSVGDFDGDGKGEVIVQVGEGARFWNSEKATFGKYLYYNGTQASYTGSGTQTVSSDGTNPDIDGDKITNYTYYSKGKNPQWYFAVIDGMTGAQKDVCAMTLPSDGDMTYTRINKSAFMTEEYSYLSPAMGAAYLDGVNQSAVAQFQCRTTDGNHHYFTYAYGYVGGVFHELWRFKFHEHKGLSEFHHIRIGDVDGDGKDEVMNGQCAVDHDGTLLWSSGIAHGDRFRMSDIDPDRPGQEIFAIQQNAGDMLGMILYDAATGSAIKKWYLPAVGDVGRGECMDVDPNHKGYEIWSTMENIYDCKGNQIGTEKPYPTEGIWWDGDLAREALITSGSGNNCPAVVAKYNNGGWQRIYEISKESSWQMGAEYGVRPMFYGDICGDWREEVILKQLSGGNEVGFVCLSTGNTTSIKDIYCLLQDPNYFGQITNRGYYQSPNTSFYLGYDMPRPPLPPFMKEDDDSQVFGLTLGNTTIHPNDKTTNSPNAQIYVLPVKDQTLTLDTELTMQNESSALWKSQLGTLNITAPITTNTIYISEGTLNSTSTLNAAIELRARGTLAGSPIVNDTIIFEGALHNEGCRLMPDGTMTFAKNLTINKKVYITMDVPSNDIIKVNGNVKVTGTPIFEIHYAESLTPGEYPLMQYGGSMTGFSKFAVEGLTGLKYELENRADESGTGGTIYLIIKGQREASNDVVWTGQKSKNWDYQTLNWNLNGEDTEFVAGDGILFTDEAKNTTVTAAELMPVGTVTFANDTKAYTIQGDGGISGNASLIFKGSGKVTLNATKSDYTGQTLIQSGTITVKELADAGIPSSLGAASADANNLQIGKATLVVNNSNTGTNRGITLTDTATVSIASGTVAFKGIVKGNGILKKTGNGQVNITYSGANTWAGTILQTGTLAMGAWNTTFGKSTSPLHVTGNATIVMFDNNSTSAMPSYQNATTIDEGKTLTFKAGSRCTIKGTLLGKGTYKISFPYVRGDVYTNVSNFEGIYDVTTSNCRFVQAMDFSKATLRLEEGAYAAGYKAGKGDEASYTHKIGTLTGTGTLGTGTWQISRLLVNYKATRTSVSCDAVTINGASTLRNLTIDMQTTSTATMPDNAEFTILKGSGKRTVTGTVTVLPSQPKPGFMWDTSRLASEGIITIAPDPTAIHSLGASDPKSDIITDLSGRRISQAKSPGVYIINGKKVYLTLKTQR